jgi:threonine aldolase
MRDLAGFCREKKLPLHLDGARIWNAHLATGIPLSEYGALVDSISVCFSKGLGAPIGSMLLGKADFIKRAHRYRKIFGGGMRQAGVLAAAADYAVETNLPKLAKDHDHALTFATELAGLGTFAIIPGKVDTNMVLMDFRSSDITAATAQQKLREAGILIGMGAGNVLRAVFHLDISDEETNDAIHRIKTVL